VANGGIDNRGTGRVRWPIRTQIIQVPRWDVGWAAVTCGDVASR
ncbi:hypothetical protein ALC57_10760, partial [Trachymyrmex cornetzi]